MNTHTSTRWVITAILVAGGMATAACGNDVTPTQAPANQPIESRIYPPTNVPEVVPGSPRVVTAEGRASQQEEKLRRAGGRPGMP